MISISLSVEYTDGRSRPARTSPDLSDRRPALKDLPTDIKWAASSSPQRAAAKLGSSAWQRKKQERWQALYDDPVHARGCILRRVSYGNWLRQLKHVLSP